MKNYLTILMVFFTICSFAQPSGDIEKDTALANRYFEQALDLFEKNDTQSIAVLEKANKLYEAHPFDEKQIEIKSKLAFYFHSNNEFKKAEELALSVVKLNTENQPNNLNFPALTFAYLTLMRVYTFKDLNQAINYALKSMACSKDHYPYYYFLSISSLMELYYTNGATQPLQDLNLMLEETLTNTTDTTLHKYYVYLYEGKMKYYYVTRDYEKALLAGKKMFAENEKYKTFDARYASSKYVALGYIYSELGQGEEALATMKQAMTHTAFTKDNPAYGNFYGHISYAYSRMKEFELAIEALKKGITYYQKNENNFRQTLATAYGNIGDYYFSLEQYDDAESHVLKAKKYSQHPVHDYQLGKILMKKGKYEASMTSLHQSLLKLCTTFKSTDIYQNPSEYEVFRSEQYAQQILSVKGEAWYLLGKSENNAEKMKAGLRLVERSAKMKETEWERAKGFDKSKYVVNSIILHLYTVVLDGYYEVYQLETSDANFSKILEITEKRKAIQLIETLSPSLLPKAVFLEEQNLLKSIQFNGQKLDLATYQNNKDSIVQYQNKLYELGQTMDAFIEKVKTNYPKQSNHFYNKDYATVEKIQQKISKDALFVLFNHQKANEGLLVAIEQSEKKTIKLNVPHLDAKIKKLNELIQDQFAFQNSVRDEFINISHELYNQFIKPIESELEGKTELMIVVEGQLFHLPFELLLKSNEKKPYHELDFLIKNYAINYHYSATVFLKLQEKETVKDHSLLAFAPVFSKGEELNEATRSLDFLIDSLYNGIDGNKFIALPSTKKEVNTIAKIVKSNNGQANILLQKNATKTNFAQQLEKQSYQFIHIATHGLVNFKNPKLSALACYSKDETMDNLMYANEIQFKNINADLVVLSSCESGIGQLVAGEGLIALNRSFIYSGAKNVMFSLWKVSDKYSSELMIDFYESYYETESYTAALRNAKLKLLENPTTAQPKFWAAFVLMGE